MVMHSLTCGRGSMFWGSVLMGWVISRVASDGQFKAMGSKTP